MNSSGIKRGLATTAITALAVTGLPFFASSASAESLASGTTATELLSPAGTDDVSIKNDGQNTTVSLVANAPAGADKVEFTYTPAGGTAQVIGSATRSANGQFALEWTPAAAIYNTTVTVTAQGMTNQNVAVGAPSVVTGVVVSTTAESVELNSNDSVGFYLPNNGSTAGTAIVSGTTSSLTVDPTIATVEGGTGAGTVEIAAATAGATSRAFKATVPVTSTLLDETGTNALNQFAVRSSVGGTSDAQAFNAYKQTISGLTATTKQAQVAGATGTTEVTVTVVDQNNKPVAGAAVAAAGGTGNGTPSNGGVTNASGQVVFTGVTVGAHKYYADDNANGAYDNGAEYAQDVTITSYTAAPDSIAFASKDGNAFDVDEVAAGDLQVTVKDQQGNPIAATVQYAWDYVPFKPTDTDKARTYTMPAASAGTDGKAEIALPATASFLPGGTFTLNAYVNRDNTPGQGTGDLSIAPASLKIGESDVVWGEKSPAQRKAGTVQEFAGKLQLADGTTLGGRDLAITLDTTPAGNDAIVSAQASQPAGTTRTGAESATVKTASDGSFAISLTDPAVTPATGQTDELGDVLTATGTAGGVGVDATEALTVDWLVNATVASVGLTADVDTTAGENDSYEELVDNVATPGRPVTFQVRVTNKADGTGTPMANQTVTLKTDNGFFTTPAATEAGLVAEPAKAAGGLYGSWKDLGKETTVTTDADGKAWVTVAIGRDSGFDDDGKVKSTISATTGGVSNTSPITVDWTSNDALNPGSVEVALADNQTVESLPKAPTTETVKFDVFTKDQFGNLTAESVTLSENAANASLSSLSVTSQYLGDAPAVTASGTGAGDMTVTGSWTNASNVWTDSDAVLAGFQAQRTTATKTVTDESETVSWYVVDYTASEYSISHSGGATQPVGSTVTTTYKAVDQNGEPIQGLSVRFFRTGPDDLQDGDGNTTATTNAQGEATYVYQGAKAGTATVTAVVRDSAGDLIPEARQTDTVTFGAEEIEPPKYIKVDLSGPNNGRKRDALRVTTTPAAGGASAQLYRVANGGRVLIATKNLWSTGKTTFRVRDTNKGRFTKYVVLVRATDATRQGRAVTRVR
ncbi:hypothetical protein [Nocardioides pacificus]